MILYLALSTEGARPRGVVSHSRIEGIEGGGPPRLGERGVGLRRRCVEIVYALIGTRNTFCLYILIVLFVLHFRFHVTCADYTWIGDQVTYAVSGTRYQLCSVPVQGHALNTMLCYVPGQGQALRTRDTLVAIWACAIFDLSRHDADAVIR